MSDFSLFLDDENEVRFSLEIEGAAPADVHASMILEGKKGFSLSFPGTPADGGEIEVVVPPLKSVLAEGTYNARLEVVVDDRLFVPLELTTTLKNSVKVEAAVKVRRRSKAPRVAAAVLSETPKPQKRKSTKTKAPSKSSKSSLKSSDRARLEELLKHLDSE